mmetsp:Transcript_10768/g.20530  ORF Transcript_10768/g.20530 Transcript_10768/m.20530 type:complete len:208 (-) Transcript_10768:746-1369(-)
MTLSFSTLVFSSALVCCCNCSSLVFKESCSSTACLDVSSKNSLLWDSDWATLCFSVSFSLVSFSAVSVNCFIFWPYAVLTLLNVSPTWASFLAAACNLASYSSLMGENSESFSAAAAARASAICFSTSDCRDWRNASSSAWCFCCNSSVFETAATCLFSFCSYSALSVAICCWTVSCDSCNCCCRVWTCWSYFCFAAVTSSVDCEAC